MKVKSKLSVFQKRRTTKCNPRTVTPVSTVCAAFAAQPRRVPTGSKKTGRCANVRERCGNGKRRRRRASNLPTNNFQNQYNSKCSWMQAADLMPLSVWTVAIFMPSKKYFQNWLFKTQFSVGLNRRTFSGEPMELPARKYFMNFCEKVPKKCVLAAYHMRGLFWRDANRPRRRRTVNDLWIFSKGLLKIAFPWPMQWGDFFRGTPLKTQNSVGSNRGSF